jgi:hypothetical protein
LCNLKNPAQSEQLLNRREFSQSGHPAPRLQTSS